MTAKTTTLFFSMFFFIVLKGFSADQPDFRSVDSLTFRYYNEQKWDSVIHVGKQALRQNIDYYYLRVRMGISYFQKQSYFTAVTHLEKARKFNSGDPFVNDFLYRAYLYTQREEEARVLKSSLPKPEAGVPGAGQETGNSFLHSAHFESGYTLSSNANPKNLATLMGTDSLYGEQDLYGNNFYTSLGVTMWLSKRINITLAYNYLKFNKTKYIRYGRLEDHFLGTADSSWGTMYLWSFPYMSYDTSFSYHVNQHEGHFGLSWSLPKGFKILPAFHLLAVNYPITSVKLDTVTVADPYFYMDYDSTLVSFPFTRKSYSSSQRDTSFMNYVIALGITKEIGIFNIGIYGSWSNLNGRKQKQAGVSLTYYPMGNLNFYGTTTFTGFFEKKGGRLLISQVLGAKITHWLWIEGNFYYGDFTNANIFNGSVVYNNSDKIDYRGGASLVFPVGRHLQFSILYQYFRKESKQIYYVHNPDNTINKTPQIVYNPYNTNTIIGGITWKF